MGVKFQVSNLNFFVIVYPRDSCVYYMPFQQVSFTMFPTVFKLMKALQTIPFKIKSHKTFYFRHLLLLLLISKLQAIGPRVVPVEVLKSWNDWQSHILLKFNEPKESIQFELSYVD